MNKDKYVALAYQNPYGVLLQEKVTSCWDSWKKLIETQGIYKTFCRYGYTESLERCAQDIYAAAIWGYGVSNWIEGQKDPEEFSRLNFFHGCQDKYLARFRGPNNIPTWFYLLDNWLENLCLELSQDILSLNRKIDDC